MPPGPGGDCLVHISSVGGDTGGGAGGAAQGNVHRGAPDNIFFSCSGGFIYWMELGKITF